MGQEVYDGISRRISICTKEFKVSRDVVFSETQFFNAREVSDKPEDILPTVADHEDDSRSVGDSEHDSEHDSSDDSKSAEVAAPIMSNEIMVQPLSTAPNATDAPSATAPVAPLPKLSNIHTR